LAGKEDFVVIMGSSWIRGSLLGAGAFGQVNLAMDRVTGAFFAVKSTVVSCSSSYQQGDVEDVVGAAAVQPNSAFAAMENEIRILQELDSEFVVRCLGSDWSEEGGKRMRNVFLEYMPGGSLSDVLKQFAGGAQQQQQPLDEQLIRSYTHSILQGIDYLHRRGIVHCDIKGKNVLVGNAGSVKLADFGSAKHVEEEEEVADCQRTTGEDAAAASERRRGRTGGDGLRQDQVTMELEEDCGVRKVKGTPLWMAPEVVLQKEQGLPSDIWSLGCTVVEMATGRAPWAHIADPFVALYQIGCTNEMPSVPASLSPEAHDFLARCFERNPRTRWTSAQLLQHPFLTGVRRTCSNVVFSKNPSTPLSPTSVLELGNGSSSSSSVVLSSSLLQNSIPPLSPPRLWRISAAFQSPTRRAAGEETGNSSSNDWWRSTSPPAEGEWIVVRSPKAATNCPVVPHKKFESKFESYYNEEEEPTDSEMMATSILQKPRPLMMRQSQRPQQEVSIIFYSSSSASTPDEEEEEVLKKEKLMGSSISSTARQLSTTTTIMTMQEYPIPQEQYKPPSSKPCSISSSSISCSPRRSPPNSAMPEKHPPSSAATCDIFHKKTWHSNLLMQQQRMMMMMQKKIVSEADLLSSNIGDSTEDCHGNNFFFFFSLSMDATQRASSFNKAFHAQWEVVVHHKKRWPWWKRQLRRLFLNSLEKYLQWFSAYNHLRLATTQGHLHCNVVPWIVNKNNCCSSRLQFHQNEFFVLSCVVDLSCVCVCCDRVVLSFVCVMIWLLCPKAFSTTPLFLFSCLLSTLQMVFKHGFSSFLLELGF